MSIEVFFRILSDTRSMSRDLADTAALLSDPGRAAMLTALIGGIALPAGELALIANVSPQTASSHLSKLISGGLLSVEQQGRHRYYRLADAEVAHAIEALLAIASPAMQPSGPPNSARSASGTLTYARSCYSHLAGSLAVQLADALRAREIVAPLGDRIYRVTKSGRSWLEEFGIPVRDRDLHDARFARRCLDWTERRHHIAGRLGSALYGRLRELRWIAPVRDSRAVRVTLEGQRNLKELLGVQ